MINKKKVLHYLRCIDEDTCQLYLADKNPEVKAAGEAWHQMELRRADFKIEQLKGLIKRRCHLLRRLLNKSIITTFSKLEDRRLAVSGRTLADSLSRGFGYKFNPYKVSIRTKRGYVDHAKLRGATTYEGQADVEGVLTTFRFTIRERE